MPKHPYLNYAVTGMKDAKKRADQAWADQDDEHFYTGVTETSMWIASADDYLEGDRPGRQGHNAAYAAARDLDQNGKIVLGLHVTRNLAIHKLIAIYKKAIGRPYPRSSPWGYAHAEWRNIEESQFERTRKPSKEMYRLVVVGKPVGGTLEGAIEFLSEQARLLG